MATVYWGVSVSFNGELLYTGVTYGCTYKECYVTRLRTAIYVRQIVINSFWQVSFMKVLTVWSPKTPQTAINVKQEGNSHISNLLLGSQPLTRTSEKL